MQISTLIESSSLTVFVEGRLDNTTAAEFDQSLQTALRDSSITGVILDFSKLAYISSMGLRSLLTLQKMLDQKKISLVLHNVGADIIEIFDMTGFSRIFVIE